MRKIGLDVGDRTIGIAVSDPLGITAQGITTLERVGIRKDAGKVLDLVKEYECDTIVIGLPLSLNGDDSEQTQKVRDFRKMLENKMRSTGLSKVKIEFYDERFTTVIAERAMKEAEMTRKQRKKIVDRQAAVIILQSYLDANGLSVL